MTFFWMTATQRFGSATAAGAGRVDGSPECLRMKPASCHAALAASAATKGWAVPAWIGLDYFALKAGSMSIQRFFVSLI